MGRRGEPRAHEAGRGRGEPAKSTRSHSIPPRIQALHSGSGSPTDTRHALSTIESEKKAFKSLPIRSVVCLQLMSKTYRH
ncbi:hypothetical protein Y027_5293 [Burkholderia pseudomallei TSV5]|nr:hypothetical protein X977_5392 [Burkholderia pseudomallei MSHR7504]KGX51030.1 hypothetical protein Y027_5293 [Burkholderia pseudomallei TSV5]